MGSTEAGHSLYWLDAIFLLAQNSSFASQWVFSKDRLFIFLISFPIRKTVGWFSQSTPGRLAALYSIVAWHWVLWGWLSYEADHWSQTLPIHQCTWSILHSSWWIEAQIIMMKYKERNNMQALKLDPVSALSSALAMENYLISLSFDFFSWEKGIWGYYENTNHSNTICVSSKYELTAPSICLWNKYLSKIQKPIIFITNKFLWKIWLCSIFLKRMTSSMGKSIPRRNRYKFKVQGVWK